MFRFLEKMEACLPEHIKVRRMSEPNPTDGGRTTVHTYKLYDTSSKKNVVSKTEEHMKCARCRALHDFFEVHMDSHTPAVAAQAGSGLVPEVA
jgi:hypothetical protein